MGPLTKLLRFNEQNRDAWIARQAASIPNGSKVLDVGAGSCPYRPLFSHCDYKAQDFAGLQDEQLRGRLGYGEMDYYCDATAIPIDSQSLDVVLCTEVMEHVPEPIRVVNEIGRLLKPGGKLIMTAPLGSGIHQEPYHYYGGYTPYWYQKFLGEAGFSNIKIETNGKFFALYAQETVRFIMKSAPKRMRGRIIKRILWTPFWAIAACATALMLPVLHALDKTDEMEDFTIGYHVVAVKG